jgi:lipid-A-disaccharide synthase
MRQPLKIGVVAGEESGNLLGADLIRALKAASGLELELVGVGGAELQILGLKTLFDPAEIALMGVSAVLRDLPRLMRRIRQTAAAVAEAKPDCLITIDSPDFSLRVARKVRAAEPAIPIVHYVSPTVWAWRPERAPKMRNFVDHVLCVLPFEVAELDRLSGPPATYVGHRLTHDPGLAKAARAQLSRKPADERAEKTLVLLPGSRRSEVRALVEPFEETVSILRQRGNRLRVLLPTVPHVAELVRSATATWDQQPEIVTNPAGKWRAFGEADAALAASGTVALELALARVPFIACYKSDRLMRLLYRFITTWSASLPNLIADRPIVPEHFDHLVRPAYIARQLEGLMGDTPARTAQRAGFAEVAEQMKTERPAGELAAEAVLNLIATRE